MADIRGNGNLALVGQRHGVAAGFVGVVRRRKRAHTKIADRNLFADLHKLARKIAVERAERLYDGADLLSAEDEAALLDRLNTLSETLQFDVVIVTAKAIGERSPMEFADD